MIRTSFFITALTFTFFGCGPSQKELDQIEYEKEKSANEELFYYPVSYDDYWRTYKANLVGAEGWITQNCSEVHVAIERLNEKPIDYYRNKKVKIINNYAKHSSWGIYKGNLSVLLIDDSTNVIIDYKDFKPDFEVGNWLSTKYKEN